jgi:spermidine synthase
MINDITLNPIEISNDIESLYPPLNLGQKSQGPYDIVIENGHLILLENLNVIMSDSNYEKIANSDFVKEAHGDVLIGGLGLGLIIKAIENKPEVTSITVVEISPDIIEMVQVESQFNNKVTIINKNIWEYKPGQGIKFDTLYIDISGMSSVLAKEKFIEKFSQYKKNEDSYINGRMILQF